MDLKLSKSKSKYLRSLRRSKQRRLSGKFPVEGEKICLEIIRDFPESIEWLMATPDFILTHEALLTLVKDRLIPVDAAEIKAHSHLESPSPVLLIAQIPEPPAPQQLPTDARILFLDALQDPGNVGTIIRTAAWFGLTAVALGPGTVDPYNAKVVQASMGAVLRIPLLSLSLNDLQSALPAQRTMGLLMQGKNIWQANLSNAGILVVGNEGSGIARENLPLVEGIHIPGHSEGTIESLNAGTAAAVAMAIWSMKN